MVRTTGTAFPDGVFAGSWKLTWPRPTNSGVRPVKEAGAEIPLTVRLTGDAACDNGPDGAGFPVPGLFVTGPMPVKYIATYSPGTAGWFALRRAPVLS